MSNSEGAVLVRLTAHAQDENTRIEVLDGNLNLVAGSSRLGETRVEVKPGAYAVRFQIGADYVQRIAILEPNSGETHVWLADDEAPHFATSAPVSQTRSTREKHRGPAQHLSLSPAIAKSDRQPGDSHLLLFARDLLEGRQNDPAQGLTLHDMEGMSVADFAIDGDRDPSERWAGAHLALPAGAYRLRLTYDNRRFVEQMIYLVKDWQTQVFLLAAGAGDRDRRVQLESASVLMAPPQQGFDPERPDLRWTESALRALRERKNIPGAVRSEMLWEKFQNPLLGIYAGLLHLRRKEIDASLLHQVFHNLMGLVGPLPDVLAIGWGLALRDANTRGDLSFMQVLERPGDLATPPMLRASWDILVEASVEEPAVIPPGSFAERASQRLMATGPWFGWRGEPPPASREVPLADEQFALPGLLGKFIPPTVVQGLATGGLGVALPVLASLLAKHPMAARLLHSPRYTDVERRVAQYVFPLVDPQLQALVQNNEALKTDLRDGMKARGTTGAGLVGSLKIPASVALGAVWGLMRKLVLQPVVPDRQIIDAFVAQESRENQVLESVLKHFAQLPSPLRHKRGGEPAISKLAIVFLRYRGSPAATKEGPPDVVETVRLLTENEYVIDAGAREPDGALLDEVVANVREGLLDMIGQEVRQKTLILPEGWQHQVLPAPDSYQRGSLLPQPVHG